MNALKKINERVKQLQKKHPKTKRTTLQKQAGREWKSGKLKAKRKTVASKKPVKRKAARRKSAKPKIVTRTRTRTIVKVVRAKRRKYVPKKKTTRRRVSGKGPSLMPVIAIAALGVGAYLLLNRAPATQQQYQPTGNYARDNSAQNILAYATAAGLTASAIAKLIQALNGSSDSTVISAGQNPQSALPAFLQGD